MIQAKFNAEKIHLDFLRHYKAYGFKNKSALIRKALENFRHELDRQRIKESARLYAEIYEDDPELQELTESAISEWPE